ncbi:MAG TPA: DUF333 domain-containing protein [Bdellovibrio sp.]|uniref:DUF333 domain-containing protein n=1 Tax=Bdellovibrio sp. TaxID=28201 RepID=UPI002EE2F943
MKSFLLISLFSTSAFAQTSLKLFENEKYKDIKITEFQKVHLGSDCIKSGKPNCQAWATYSGKPKENTKANTPLAGDPAAHYCWDVGAKNRILKSSDNKEYDYCIFDDGSMIDAWDLYYKHFPRK